MWKSITKRIRFLPFSGAHRRKAVSEARGGRQFRRALLIVDKPLVCQRGLPGRLSTHRSALTLARCSVVAHYASLRVLATSALRASDGQRPGRECIFTFRTALALRRRGVPCLRTSCARHFSPSGLRLFASICSRKMPEMTYTPSFLIRTSFF